MVQKRPGEEFGDFSLKQPRYLESGDENVSNLDAPGENMVQVQHDLGVNEGLPTKSKHHCNGRLDNFHIPEAELLTFTDKDLDTSALGAFSNSSWATSTTSEEDNESEAAFRILFSPAYYNLEHPVSIIVQPGDLYYALLEYPPQKLIPLGREFQAELPERGADHSKKLASSFGDACEASCLPSNSLELDSLGSSEEYNKLAGTCVFPMPGLDEDRIDGEKPGSGRTECSCEDAGSTRCVKQHIGEARLRLRMTVGAEAFCKLGFDDMGEVVAEKWNEEEKEMFHEVIFYNPASQGMNFWDHLATAFPSRTKREIVSFYFNVFILGKRSEQNRSNLYNVDSDNDELEVTNVSAEVIEKVNEDDDSLSESQGADIMGNEIYEETVFVNDDRVHSNSLDHATENFSGNEVIDYVQQATSADVVDNSISNPSSQVVFFGETGGYDVQNGFSTLNDRGELPGHDVQNGASAVCDGGEVDGPDVQNGASNVHVEGESEGYDGQNGTFTMYKNGWPPAVTSEETNRIKNFMCSSSATGSRDGCEPDTLPFQKNEDYLQPTGCDMKTRHL